ncbi:uncharacterized protein LOC110112375 isoform X1 [Dendrobium catenatum]|uniref:uncharacterized protein LOC110112375 isoform X1 n=1 Tax=Dendrobium catenatum TaxID=906689 RepID=UPI00109FB78B|nr:uncharacterized protein LOC110112375 isoform X1 [Dendrobium catenatum]
MSAIDGSVKRTGKDGESLRSDKKRRAVDEFDDDLDLSSDIKGIISALQQIRDKAQKDGQKKNEETIMSVASEIKSMIDDAKSKFEKESCPTDIKFLLKLWMCLSLFHFQVQSFLKALAKSSKEYESSLKSEYNKFQAAYQKFSNEKASHLQIFKDIFSKYELDKEKLISRYEQMRKKEKAALSELEKAFTNKIARSEEALKKKKQDDKSFSFLRKSLGSFLEVASDDE